MTLLLAEFYRHFFLLTIPHDEQLHFLSTCFLFEYGLKMFFISKCLTLEL